MARCDDDDDADNISKWPSWWVGWQPVLRATDAMKQMDENDDDEDHSRRYV